jgi:hypothetical protein
VPITSIDGYVFSGYGVTSITVGTNLTNIAVGAFGYSASLIAINVNPANPAYASSNGILFTKTLTTLVQYPGGIPGPYTIPNNVTDIAEGAFADCDLGTVSIPSSVLKIEDGVRG